MLPVADGKPAGAPALFRPDLGSGHPIRMTPAGSYYYGVPVAMNDIYSATLDATMSELTAPPVQAVQRFVGTNKWPEWSPDGTQLAYVSQVRFGQGDSRPLVLIIEPIDGGPRRDLTLPFTFLSRLRWAPDGGSLLSNARDRTGRGGLFRIDVQSGDATLIVPSTGLPRQSAWLRDGKAILYWDINRGPDAQIMKRDLASGAEQAVHRGGDFALSPDNRWLVVSGDDSGNQSSVLELAPLSGGGGRELLRERGSGAFNAGCSWTPDSRHVLCIKAPAGGTSELWRFSVDDTPPRRLLVMDGMSEIRVNPDGRRIAFSIGKGAVELWVMENFLPATAPRTRRP